MTKFTRCLLILLCIVIIFCSVSCDNNSDDSVKPNRNVVVSEKWELKMLRSDELGVKYDYYFRTVEDLLIQVKYDPDLYNNKKVKVLGTLSVFKDSSDAIQLVDFIATSQSVPLYKDKITTRMIVGAKLLRAEHKIDIDISSDTQYAVAETGDYVKIYGTIVIDRDGIYIEDCQYHLIASINGRINNIIKQEEQQEE